MQRRLERCRVRKWAWLALCLLLAGMYATAIWAQWGFSVCSGVLLSCNRGGVTLTTYTVPSPPTFPVPRMFNVVRSEGPIEWMPHYGHTAAASAAGWDIRFVSIPLWMVLAAAVVPAARAWRADARTRRAQSPSSCGTCGYDRRGLAADGKCPECGTVPTPAAM